MPGPSTCIFVSDLHGSIDRYSKLFRLIRDELPRMVFLGGDLLPSFLAPASRGQIACDEFPAEYLMPQCESLRAALRDAYPEIFLILGNDDIRTAEAAFISGGEKRLWRYMHNARADAAGRRVYGYACVPPTPFRLKDWERYDVSRYVDIGCVSPEEGTRSIEVDPSDVRYGTIQKDLQQLAGSDDLSEAIVLFHAPPYNTALDRAALDGVVVDHVPVDLHIGSIAIRKFIEERQPLVTLHGHVHESARLTGRWRDRIGRTHAFTAAHDGPELAVVRFAPEDPGNAGRELL